MKMSSQKCRWEDYSCAAKLMLSFKAACNRNPMDEKRGKKKFISSPPFPLAAEGLSQYSNIEYTIVQKSLGYSNYFCYFLSTWTNLAIPSSVSIILLNLIFLSLGKSSELRGHPIERRFFSIFWDALCDFCIFYFPEALELLWMYIDYICSCWFILLLLSPSIFFLMNWIFK